MAQQNGCSSSSANVAEEFVAEAVVYVENITTAFIFYVAKACSA